MIARLSYLVPNMDDLLALEVEELAGVLLVHLNSCGDNSGDSVVQHSKISLHNFIRTLESKPEYSDQARVIRALMEAWAWLQAEALLVPTQEAGWFFLSRRAQTLRSRDQFDAFRKASLFPRGQLHPLVATKVYPAFLRGEYDTAVFQAFREVEVAVRRAGKFDDDEVGVHLMREAFRPQPPSDRPGSPGRLTDTTLPSAEQEAMMNLFAGAIGLFKNPQSHRNMPMDPPEAAEVIMFASHLLRIVGRRGSPTTP
jgi:uncharacterized protein (TIGR02391 family)